MIQTTFCIIKPDAIERGLVGRIITRIEDASFRVGALSHRPKTTDWVKAHYAHITDQQILDELIEFMTVMPLIGFVTSGPFACERVRQIVGATDPRQAAPGTIRGDLGFFPIRYNLIHAADSPESADREIKLFYNPAYDQQRLP